MSNTPQSPISGELLGAIHEDVKSLFESGLVDKKTLRGFDEMCLTPAQPITPEEIKQIREREGVSQPVFAWYLNVSGKLISDWERGVRNPGGAALKLLNLVRVKGLEAIA